MTDLEAKMMDFDSLTAALREPSVLTATVKTIIYGSGTVEIVLERPEDVIHFELGEHVTVVPISTPQQRRDARYWNELRAAESPPETPQLPPDNNGMGP